MGVSGTKCVSIYVKDRRQLQVSFIKSTLYFILRQCSTLFDNALFFWVCVCVCELIISFFLVKGNMIPEVPQDFEFFT